MSRSKRTGKDTEKNRCYSCHGFGHVSKVCPSRRESSERKKSACESTERVKSSDASNKAEDCDQSTEQANVAATSPKDLVSMGDHSGSYSVVSS